MHPDGYQVSKIYNCQEVFIEFKVLISAHMITILQWHLVFVNVRSVCVCVCACACAHACTSIHNTQLDLIKNIHKQQNTGLSWLSWHRCTVVEMVTVCVQLSEVIITPLTGLLSPLSCRELTLTMTAIFDKILPQQFKLSWECQYPESKQQLQHSLSLPHTQTLTHTDRDCKLSCCECKYLNVFICRTQFASATLGNASSQRHTGLWSH